MIKLNDLKILVIALVAAVSIAFVIRFIFFADDSPKEKPVNVVTAVRNLNVGQPIEESMIRLQPMPKELVISDYVVVEDKKDMETVVGSIVRFPVAVGEPIKRSEIIAIGQKGVLSALISPGKRAYTIPLGHSSAVSSLISPGDLVDVIVAYRQTGDKGFVAKTVLEGVRVLEIDGSFKKAESEGAQKQPQHITVEVDERQAKQLAGELKVGEPTISLHSVKVSSGVGSVQQQAMMPGVVGEQPPQELTQVMKKAESESDAVQHDIAVLRGSEKTVLNLKNNSDTGQ
ncbi:MAG: Flp pilus assembly protein CpaB [Alphaproteobacteria bacterium]|nr:Flp pilus assembly protein CpaB [Alphaproteobacteria bacterium]